MKINLKKWGVIIKLPNGYGSVYKLPGKRRKPWIARKTACWDIEESEGQTKQKYFTIGYYKTKTEALQALAIYNNDPYDLLMSKFTFEDIYQKWFDDTFDDNSNRSTVKNYTAAYKHCSSLYKLKISEIKLVQMQRVIDECPNGYQSASRIKILFKKVFDWCIEREYIKKNYALNLKVPKVEQQKQRKAFTKEQIQLFWDIADINPNVPIILILIYSGVRINELLELKKEDVNLEEQWFRVRASKTNSGIRIVPIADKVLHFWKAFLNRSKCAYAITTPDGQRFTYDNFRRHYWTPLMEKLNLDFTAHETRHTCVSLLLMANTNPTIRKKIIGHKSQMDLGEAVYGHIYNEELLKAINKI